MDWAHDNQLLRVPPRYRSTPKALARFSELARLFSHFGVYPSAFSRTRAVRARRSSPVPFRVATVLRYPVRCYKDTDQVGSPLQAHSPQSPSPLRAIQLATQIIDITFTHISAQSVRVPTNGEVEAYQQPAHFQHVHTADVRDKDIRKQGSPDPSMSRATSPLS